MFEAVCLSQKLTNTRGSLCDYLKFLGTFHLALAWQLQKKAQTLQTAAEILPKFCNSQASPNLSKDKNGRGYEFRKLASFPPV